MGSARRRGREPTSGKCIITPNLTGLASVMLGRGPVLCSVNSNTKRAEA